MTYPVVTNWYTPAEIVDAARAVMGGIDLDPASCADANKVVRAATFYTAEDDGLKHEWHGRVWLNPPTDTIGLFADKLLHEYRLGYIYQAVAFTHSATHEDWYQKLSTHASAVCLPAGRITHWRPNDEQFDPPWGQSIFCFGGRPDLFEINFEQFGTVWAI